MQGKRSTTAYLLRYKRLARGSHIQQRLVKMAQLKLQGDVKAGRCRAYISTAADVLEVLRLVVEEGAGSGQAILLQGRPMLQSHIQRLQGALWRLPSQCTPAVQFSYSIWYCFPYSPIAAAC